MLATYLKSTEKFHIYEAKKDVTIKVDGQEKIVKSSQGIRIYADFKASNIEVQMTDLIAMKMKDGSISQTMYWL